jgi:hypothetical protein
MVAVLLLFILPVGGGIPAGVLLARKEGLGWFLTGGLYLASDVLLALAFEPVLRLLVAAGRRIRVLARVVAALKAAMARSVALMGGRGAGPFAVIMIAFGADPMTGRATAMAAGHGLLSGWVLAITGDMLYYAVIAASTLGLNRFIKDPTLTVLVILGAMFLAPMAVSRLRHR